LDPQRVIHRIGESACNQVELHRSLLVPCTHTVGPAGQRQGTRIVAGHVDAVVVGAVDVPRQHTSQGKVTRAYRHQVGSLEIDSLRIQAGKVRRLQVDPLQHAGSVVDHVLAEGLDTLLK